VVGGLGNEVVVQWIPVLCDELAAERDQYVPVKLHIYEGVPATN
jgi:hypothetical protein